MQLPLACDLLGVLPLECESDDLSLVVFLGEGGLLGVVEPPLVWLSAEAFEALDDRAERGVLCRGDCGLPPTVRGDGALCQ